MLEKYLLDFVFIALFAHGDVVRALLGILNLFPSFHFLLLKQSNTIGKKLSIVIESTNLRVRNPDQQL